MFRHRSSAFGSSVPALEGRVRALESELERVGRKAGRGASLGVSAAGDHIGDAIAAAVTEIVDRFRNGRRLAGDAGDEAARFGNEAVKFGAKFGNDALHRMATEVEHRPLVTMAVAVGVGILIGMAGGITRSRH